MTAHDGVALHWRGDSRGVISLHVQGELDVATMPVLLGALDAALDDGVRVELDLRGVTFAGAAALDLLEHVPAHVALGDVSPSVERLLLITAGAQRQRRRNRPALWCVRGTTRDRRRSPRPITDER